MKLNESNFFSVRKKKRSLKEMKLGKKKAEAEKKRNFFSKKKELSGEQRANSRNRSKVLSTCPLYMKSNNPAM